MVSRITLAALVVAAASPALAQSATGTNFQTKPVQPAPNLNNPDAGKNIPPPARSGEKGLRTGPGATQDDQFVTIKRNK